MNKKIYIIWIGWIWVSAIARYYLYKWWKVSWSDKVDSKLIQELKKEWINIIIWEDKNRIDNSFSKIVYTEAVSKNQEELKKAFDLKLDISTYAEELSRIANKKKLIGISWSHWKSTTTSLTSLVLKNSIFNVNSVVWSILKEFWNKNAFFSDSDYFVIEACEYKRSFLKYKPYIWIITNIDLDHLDYYKDLEDYISAFEEYLWNIVPWWYAIINWNCENSKSLLWKRKDINYIIIEKDNYKIKDFSWEIKKYLFPEINMKVPWEHILFDAKIAYVIWVSLKIEEKYIIRSLENYTWIWRRMEIIWETKNKNILISDYWHHPTEIKLTLNAIKNKYKDKKILTIFQPHQYNRTIELLEWFKNCFLDTDKLIIPNIYESRDSEEDKKNMTTQIFLDNINHWDKLNWDWFENTINLINDYDIKNPAQCIIILLWAGDIDDLKYKIN